MIRWSSTLILPLAQPQEVQIRGEFVEAQPLAVIFMLKRLALIAKFKLRKTSRYPVFIRLFT